MDKKEKQLLRIEAILYAHNVSLPEYMDDDVRESNVAAYRPFAEEVLKLAELFFSNKEYETDWEGLFSRFLKDVGKFVFKIDSRYGIVNDEIKGAMDSVLSYLYSKIIGFRPYWNEQTRIKVS